MATVFFYGDGLTLPDVTLAGESSWTLVFHDDGTAGITFDNLVLKVATYVTIVSEGFLGGSVSLSQLTEVPNDLTTVTIVGPEVFSLGSGLSGNSNSGDGVVTDILATAKVPTTIHSSLTLIDASATSGGVIIYASATNTSSDGDFGAGGGLNANITISYTGLTIEGGSGSDFIENDARNGIVTVGNGRADTVDLGGSGAHAILGTGADDTVVIGISNLGTTETAGSVLGDSVTFGAAATASLVVGMGAEAGATAGTPNIGMTKVHDAVDGMVINFGGITDSSNIVDESSNPTVTSATTLAAAENAAVKAMFSGGVEVVRGGVAYFVYKGNEYFIATNNIETTVSADDAIVKLVGITDIHHAINSGGLVTLHV